MGTAIVKLKMSQDISIVYQYPLSLVFLYLKKSYDTLYHRCLLQTLEGYGAGPKLAASWRISGRTNSW